MLISSIIGEKCGPRSGTEVSKDKSWLKTSNSSSESVTFTTSSSFEFLVRDGVVISINCCDEKALLLVCLSILELNFEHPQLLGQEREQAVWRKYLMGLECPQE